MTTLTREPDAELTSVLARLAGEIASVSPDWERVVVAPADTDPAPEAAACAGAAHLRAGFETIREGWLLHRSASRLVQRASPDLALLIGDWCYAHGLTVITEHGSLDDVALLAELVADVATRHHESIDALQPRWDAAETELLHG